VIAGDSNGFEMAIRAHVSFPLREKRDLDGRIAAHFSRLGYRLNGRSSNEWVFRRGSKLAALWRCDIRSYATTLHVRSTTESHGDARVSCDWEVWTFATPTREIDVALLEAEGRELKSLLRRTDPAHLP
jgi:hypothetical protein